MNTPKESGSLHKLQVRIYSSHLISNARIYRSLPMYLHVQDTAMGDSKTIKRGPALNKPLHSAQKR